jgi:hypothetical protein
VEANKSAALELLLEAERICDRMSATTLTLSKKEATEQSYRALAGPYVLPGEQPMLDNVIADMRRGGIEFVLVSADGAGLEVWRKGLVRP